MEYAVGAFGVAFVVIGLLLMNNGRKFIKKSKSIQYWPQVEGKIVDNEISEGYNNENKVYSAYIEYDYQVNGEEYTNSDISLAGDGSTNNFEFIESICDKYPLDSTQTVYYNPEDPEESYLELSSRGVMLYFLGGGLCSALWYFCFLVILLYA